MESSHPHINNGTTNGKGSDSDVSSHASMGPLPPDLTDGSLSGASTAPSTSASDGGSSATTTSTSTPKDLPNCNGHTTLHASETSNKNTMIWSNTFELGNWPKERLHHYKIEFEPALGLADSKYVWRRHQARFPYANEFDGEILHNLGRISRETMQNISNARIRIATDQVVKTKLALIEADDPKRNEYTDRFYESLCERLLVKLNYKKVGHGFFDFEHVTDVKIEGFPFMMVSGFSPKLMERDNKLVLTLRNVQQVVQTDNVLQTISKIKSEVKQNDGTALEYQRLVEAEVIGGTVLTPHNFLSYKIDYIHWDETPDTPMISKNGATTYGGYHLERYGLIVSTPNQPLLISKNEEFWGEKNGAVKRDAARLIPELSNMLDLSPSMRRNPKVVKGLATVLASMTTPDMKIDAIKTFMQQLRSTADSHQVLGKWGLKIKQDLVTNGVGPR